MPSHYNTTNTRSGWQGYDENNRLTHTWVWIPEDYGFLAADPADAYDDEGHTAGQFCENCGKWDGPKLKRGELKRMREQCRPDRRGN